MTTLLKFELRKIFARRPAQLALLGVVLLSLLLNFSAYFNMYAYDGGAQDGHGASAVALDKEIAARYAGELTDGKVEQMLADLAPGDLHGLNAAYLYQNATQSALFCHFANPDGGWNGRSVAEVFGAAGQELKIGYVLGWLTSSRNLVKVLLLLALAEIVMLAGVFAGEYDGVDNIILTSRHGRTLVCAAKVLAGLLAALLSTAAALVLNLSLALLLYGPTGLDCSILFAPTDFSEAYIPYNISCATLLAYQIMLAFCGALSVAGLTLLCSALCRSQLGALCAAAAFYLLPVLLPLSENSPLFRLVSLLPLYQAQFVALMSVEQLGGNWLYAVWAAPAALLGAVVGSALAWRVFAVHQVV